MGDPETEPDARTHLKLPFGVLGIRHAHNFLLAHLRHALGQSERTVR